MLAATADFIVIGGGVIGMFTARELRATGASVLLLERGLVARESSWAGGGILSPLYPWRYTDAVSVLSGWSQQQYPEIIEALQSNVDFSLEWIRSGMLVFNADDKKGAEDWAQCFQIPIKEMSGDELEIYQRGLNVTPDRALCLPEVAQVRTPRLGKALRQDLQNSGVEIVESCKVLRILDEKNRVTGVETDRGYFGSDTVIVAGGAWSANILKTLGVSIPVKPMRGQMILIKCQPGVLDRMVLQGEHYLIPRKDGRVLAGSTVEDVGFKNGLTKDAMEELYQWAVETVPALKQGQLEHHWSGLRPGTVLNNPIIGMFPEYHGLWVNTGHFRNGLVLAPGSARYLADEVLERQKNLVPGAFSPSTQVDTVSSVV